MRRNKNAPALYELMGAPRPGSSTPHVAPSHSAPAPIPPAMTGTDDGPGFKLGPGRAVSIPLGYLIAAGLVVFVLLVAAFATGYRRKESEIARDLERQAALQWDGTLDPLQNPQNPSGGSNGAQPAGSQPQPAQPRPRPEPTKRPPSQAVPAPQNPPQGAPTGVNRPQVAPPKPAQGMVVPVTGPENDPRQSGLNYLIAATLPPDEAEKAGQFLASEGLEIAIVTVDNRPSLRWVVVLQGLAAKDLAGPAARALERRLQELGREYRDVHRGPTVFNDPWWKKHTK